MILREILENIDPVTVRGDLDIEINSIEYDSRQIQNKSLFICIEGFTDDGHLYIDQAIKNGAEAILIEKNIPEYREQITYIRVNNSRRAMSYLAATFYNYPLENLNLIGVTGTNGKTTTTYLIKAILEKAGYKTGLIGTIKSLINDQSLPSTRTTPESIDLYQMFRKMVDAGADYAVMEVSSHALDLERVVGMEFKIAVFTNVSQDHLDYHNSIEEYLEVKSKLFKQLQPDGYGVINIDDAHSQKIINTTVAGVYTYGINNKADLKAERINLSPHSTSFAINDRDEGSGSTEINLKLTGRFNVYNSLAAIGTARVLNIDDSISKSGLVKMEGVPGRFEQIEEGQDFTVVVDYAHTPDGMENVLETAVELVKGNIIVVFGCGGDRDRGKRPQMGKVAARYGKYCVITSDNPRSEEPGDIIRQIETGIKEMEQEVNYIVIPDRRKAIYHAVEKAGSGDMVIIFGKGHETYQIFKDKTIHFDDREVAREALADSGRGN